MHQLMAATLDSMIDEIQAIQKTARSQSSPHRPGVADDYSAQPKRLDRPEVCGWQTSLSVYGSKARSVSIASFVPITHLPVLIADAKSGLHQTQPRRRIAHRTRLHVAPGSRPCSCPPARF